MKKRYLHILWALISILLLFSLSFNALSQTSEHIVILWDVTGSLLPKEKGMKDLNGKPLPTYDEGNGLFVCLKEAVIDCIGYVEEDPSNDITVVTFNDDIRDIYSSKATAAGKDYLKNIVINYPYKGHNYTNIVAAINKFYGLLDANRINYMFLFTDGDNDHPATKNLFIPTLDSWTKKTKDKNAFGFYVLVHPDADKPAIRNSVESQDNFWIVEDAKVRIKICSLPSSLKYNLRDDKGPKTINIQGKYSGAEGNVSLLSNDEYYDVICSDSSIGNGKLDFNVKPKAGTNPPINHTVVLTPDIKDADHYTFVGPKDIHLEVSNLPERNLNLTIGENDLGKASYYAPFLFSKESNKPVNSDITIHFSNQAKEENSSAVMKVYFIDRHNAEKVSPESLNLKISIDGNEMNGDSYVLTPGMSNLNLSISGDPSTKDGTYYGRIELIPSKLDNYSINGTPDVFKWKMHFSHNWNPLKIWLAWLLAILMAAFFLWMFILKPIFYPRFGTIQKTFNVPGMMPLIVRFKGARMVVVAASHQKKQSGWNRFWTGKILYKTHEAFVTPIIFKPSRGRRVLARVQTGTYQVLPNPMPGIGSATIVDIKKNMKINVN